MNRSVGLREPHGLVKVSHCSTNVRTLDELHISVAIDCNSQFRSLGINKLVFSFNVLYLC